MDDEERWAYYNDPAHRESVGPAQRRSRPGLTSHVPVRFPPDLIAAVKQLALRDGMTVSSWIRLLVQRAVSSRLQGDGHDG